VCSSYKPYGICSDDYLKLDWPYLRALAERLGRERHEELASLLRKLVRLHLQEARDPYGRAVSEIDDDRLTASWCQLVTHGVAEVLRGKTTSVDLQRLSQSLQREAQARGLKLKDV
jgi:hypothetical protein